MKKLNLLKTKYFKNEISTFGNFIGFSSLKTILFKMVKNKDFTNDDEEIIIKINLSELNLSEESLFNIFLDELSKKNGFTYKFTPLSYNELSYEFYNKLIVYLEKNKYENYLNKNHHGYLTIEEDIKIRWRESRLRVKLKNNKGEKVRRKI